MIEKVAYLRMCPLCGRHAQVVLPDGNTSRHFASREEGRAQVIRLLAMEKIAVDEARFLTEQINAAALPEREPFIGDLLNFIADLHDDTLFPEEDQHPERTLH